MYASLTSYDWATLEKKKNFEEKLLDGSGLFGGNVH